MRIWNSFHECRRQKFLLFMSGYCVEWFMLILCMFFLNSSALCRVKFGRRRFSHLFVCQKAAALIMPYERRINSAFIVEALSPSCFLTIFCMAIILMFFNLHSVHVAILKTTETELSHLVSVHATIVYSGNTI